MIIGIFAADKRVCENVGPLFAREVAYRFAMMDAIALVGMRQDIVQHFRRREIVAFDAEVAADTNVLDSGDRGHVVDVINDIIYRGRLVVLDHEADEVHAHDASGLRHAADGLIRNTTGMVRIQRAAVAVGDDHRSFGNFEGIEHGAIAGMATVHNHADAVHALHDRSAELADAVVMRFERPVAHQVAEVVGEL